MHACGMQAQASTHVAQATQLEQWLMEGAYTKVLGARQSAPDPAYGYFLDKLQATVRCSPMCHASLSKQSMQPMATSLTLG